MSLAVRGYYDRLSTRGYWPFQAEAAAEIQGVNPRQSRRRATLTLDVSSEVVGEVGVTFSLPTNLDVTAEVVRTVEVTAEEEDE